MLFNYRFILKHYRLLKAIESRNIPAKSLSSSTATTILPLVVGKGKIINNATDTSIKFGYLSALPARKNLSTQNQRPYIHPKLSYVFGKSNEHLIYSTVSREFDRQIREMPDEVAYISHVENKQVTFRELERDVNKLAKALVKRFNIVKGDHLGVFSYNCYNWLLIEFACALVGAILTPINPSNKSSELAFILKKGKVKCLFMQGPKSVQSELNNHLEVLQSEKIIAMTQLAELNLKNVILMDGENEYNITTSDNINSEDESFDGLSINFKLSNCALHNWSSTETDGIIYKSHHEAEEAGISETDTCIINPDLLSPDDLFAVYYTSGTTGNPKGACISHFTVLNNVRSGQSIIRAGRHENWKAIIVTALPMFHIYAGVLTTLSPILNNSLVIYSSYKYDIKIFVDSILKYHSNTITLTPTILIDMLTHIEMNKITEVPLKIIQSGGAPLSPEVVARTFKILPNLEEVRTGYGSTENGAIATFQSIHEPTEARPFTVGSPIHFCEIRIVDPKTEQVVAHGERGEIHTRGYNTMIEYLDEPEKTAEVITPNRWYKTGDIGFMHPHGSIEICGRLKHMIIKGGENIYPEEVEQLIHKLGYVEDAHVVGVPDKRLGEQVCAWIKLKPGFKEAKTRDNRGSDMEIHKDDIIKFCQENITYFKVPKYILFVDNFPMTPTKKVQKNLMSKQTCELLGIGDQIF